MQIDFTTFVLELINFAVLVWILNRFLYRPVQAVMARRRAAIEKTVQDAENTKKEAEELRGHYEEQLADWDKEREKKRAELTSELATIRDKGIEEARQEADKETQRLAAANAKKQADAQRQLEKRALEQGAAFAARFLERLSGPDLDARLADLFAQDMQNWPKDKIKTLAAAAQDAGGQVSVVSANDLPAAAQKALAKTLSDTLGQNCKPSFSSDKTLITGVRVTIGPWVLEADAADELEFFAGAN